MRHLLGRSDDVVDTPVDGHALQHHPVQDLPGTPNATSMSVSLSAADVSHCLVDFARQNTRDDRRRSAHSKTRLELRRPVDEKKRTKLPKPYVSTYKPT